MDPSNINFKLLSLNARGIRSFEKRKALFGWLMKDKSDICFLQESYSTPEVEKIWKSQWKGELFFSHGTEHSKGVLILIKNSLEFELKTLKVDQNGRFIILEANVQDHPFLLINLYAPNKTNEQSTFFEEISEELDNLSLAVDCNIVIGGDFNVIFDPDLDGNGGNPKRKESVKCIDNMCLTNDLIDIWRIRNPNVKRFTWRQKTPVIQRRLDFWLVSNGMQEDIDNVDVIPSLKSDHSAIVLSINGIENSPRGPSFWKLNSSLLDDKEYVSLINMKYPLWNDEFKDVTDPRLFWDLMKYRIRQESISYSKLKARERRSKMAALESKFNDCQKMCDQDPSPENMNKFEVLKTEFELQNDYITQGAIIRTRATWYEQGEKSNKYFLNLENSRRKKLYSLAFETTLDTKLREFQYKILNLIIFTNKKLHRFKMVDSPLCAFCNAEEESLEHLLYLCKISSFFWKELLSWIAVEANIVLNASLLDILFGKFDLEKDFLLVNHMFLLAKYFIYKCKLSQVIPTLLVFKAKLKATYKVELYIAKEKGILPNHYKKWDNFLSWLS